MIAAAPVTDTIKEVGDDGRTVQRTLDRARLWAVQTPQVFRRAALERALAVTDDELAQATDDAWLVERAGGVVRIVGSDPGNLKITTREDLRVAELLLSRAGAPAMTTRPASAMTATASPPGGGSCSAASSSSTTGAWTATPTPTC